MARPMVPYGVSIWHVLTFNSDSIISAEQSQRELTDKFYKLLESDKDMARRLMNRDDAFEAQSVVSRMHDGMSALSVGAAQISIEDGTPRTLLRDNQPSEDDISSGPSTPPNTLPSQLLFGFDFQGDLETSRPYRRANRDSMDFSFRSSVARSHMWSVFSDLSLSDISNLSVIALPIYADEITNACHYEFGGRSLEAPSPLEAPVSRPSPKLFLRECLEIELKLSQTPAFRVLFIQERATGDEHPFWVLHRIFRRGSPLMMLYNLWEPRSDQQFDVRKERKSWAAFILIYRAMAAFSSVPEFRGLDLNLKSGHVALGEITDFFKVGAAAPSAPSFSPSPSIDVGTGIRSDSESLVTQRRAI